MLDRRIIGAVVTIVLGVAAYALSPLGHFTINSGQALGGALILIIGLIALLTRLHPLLMIFGIFAMLGGALLIWTAF